MPTTSGVGPAGLFRHPGWRQQRGEQLLLLRPTVPWFYLTPGSPCVDHVSTTATTLGPDGRTTRIDGTSDSGVVDLGYHYATGFTLAYPNALCRDQRQRRQCRQRIRPTPSRPSARHLGGAGRHDHLPRRRPVHHQWVDIPSDPERPMRACRSWGRSPAPTIINAWSATAASSPSTSLSGGTTIQGVTLTGGKITAAPLNGAAHWYACGNLTFASRSIEQHHPGGWGVWRRMYIDASPGTFQLRRRKDFHPRHRPVGLRRWNPPGLQRTTDHS